jgi:hypothetical protein
VATGLNPLRLHSGQAWWDVARQLSSIAFSHSLLEFCTLVAAAMNSAPTAHPKPRLLLGGKPSFLTFVVGHPIIAERVVVIFRSGGREGGLGGRKSAALPFGKMVLN